VDYSHLLKLRDYLGGLFRSLERGDAFAVGHVTGQRLQSGGAMASENHGVRHGRHLHLALTTKVEGRRASVGADGLTVVVYHAVASIAVSDCRQKIVGNAGGWVNVI